MILLSLEKLKKNVLLVLLKLLIVSKAEFYFIYRKKAPHNIHKK